MLFGIEAHACEACDGPAEIIAVWGVWNRPRGGVEVKVEFLRCVNGHESARSRKAA